MGRVRLSQACLVCNEYIIPLDLNHTVNGVGYVGLGSGLHY